MPRAEALEERTLLSAGNLDVTFGGTGKVTTAFGATPATAHGLAIQSDGKLVAAGGSGNSFALARYFSTSAVADLNLTKSVDNSMPLESGVIQYTLRVDDIAGPASATGVTVTDRLPAGVTFLSASGTGSYSPLTGVWTIGTLSLGNTATMRITAAVNVGTAGQTITNTAIISGTQQYDPNTANNIASAPIIVQQPADLALTNSTALLHLRSAA